MLDSGHAELWGFRAVSWVATAELSTLWIRADPDLLPAMRLVGGPSYPFVLDMSCIAFEVLLLTV